MKLAEKIVKEVIVSIPDDVDRIIIPAVQALLDEHLKPINECLNIVQLMAKDLETLSIHSGMLLRLKPKLEAMRSTPLIIINRNTSNALKNAKNVSRDTLNTEMDV